MRRDFIMNCMNLRIKREKRGQDDQTSDKKRSSFPALDSSPMHEVP